MSAVIPERLVAAREAKGWSQADLAKHVEGGTTAAAIGYIEVGQTKRPRLLREIATALDVSESYLLGIDGTSQPAGATPSHIKGLRRVSARQPATPKRIRLEFNELVTVDQAHRICAILNEREG